jgi:hypothetical protein
MPEDPRNLFYSKGGLMEPAAHADLVSPSDTTDLTSTSRSLLIGEAGDIRVTTVGGETVTFPVVAGQLLPLMVTRVHATGTTASAVVSLW